MISTIHSWYNKPSCFFKYDVGAMQFIIKLVNELLEAHPLKVKSSVLEILLCNDGTDRFEIEKTSTGRGEYLTFQFWLPYPKITRENKVTDLEPFIAYLFDGLVEALTPFGMPETEIRKRQEVAQNEIIGNPKYEFQPSRDDLVMDKILAQMKEQYKDNPNVII